MTTRHGPEPTSEQTPGSPPPEASTEGRRARRQRAEQGGPSALQHPPVDVSFVRGPLGGSRFNIIAASAVFVVLMMGPWVAGMFGIHSGDDEQSAPAINLSSLMKRDTYVELEQWIDEQLPGRSWAQDTIANLDYRVYKDSLNVQDVVGNDGWVFERIELDLFCPGPTELGLTAPSIDLSPGAARDQIARLSAIVRATGRQFAYVIAPSRAYAYPDKLGERAQRLTRCATTYRDGLLDALASAPVDGVIPLWSPIRDASSPAGSTVYYPHDLHWTTSGAAILTQGLVDHFQPGLWDGDALDVIGTNHLRGAALQQIGVEGVDEVPLLGVVRPGVTPTLVAEYRDPSRPGNEDPLPADQHYITTGNDGVLLPPEQPYLLQEHPLIQFHTESDGADLVPGTTAIVHDSFVWWTPSLLPPYFENVDLLYHTPVTQGTVLTDRWSGIDRLVVESSETLLLPGLAPDEALFSRLVSPAFGELEQVPITMPQPSEGWTASNGGLGATGDDSTPLTVSVPTTATGVAQQILAISVTADDWDDDVPVLQLTDRGAAMQVPFATVPAIHPGDGITTRTLLFDLAGLNGTAQLQGQLGEASEIHIDSLATVDLGP